MSLKEILNSIKASSFGNIFLPGSYLSSLRENMNVLRDYANESSKHHILSVELPYVLDTKSRSAKINELNLVHGKKSVEDFKLAQKDINVIELIYAATVILKKYDEVFSFHSVENIEWETLVERVVNKNPNNNTFNGLLTNVGELIARDKDFELSKMEKVLIEIKQN